MINPGYLIALAVIVQGEGSVPEGELEILLVGNAGVQLSDGQTTLLVDLPYQSGAFGYQEYAPDSLRPCCAPVSVVTHDHRDHFAVELFLARGGWRVVGPPSVVATLPSKRVLDGDSVTVGRFGVIAVPTPHTPDHRSYRIRWGSRVLFFTGDTEDIGTLATDMRFDLLFVTPWLACALVDAGHPLPAERTLIYHLQANGSDRICGPVEVLHQGATLRLD